MKLRVISGELKGRYVVTGDDADYRPTQERVRESVAEIIRRRIRGARAADLCAGSGAFGFEMISRGASFVDFVEMDRRKAAGIGENAERFGVGDRVRVWREDVKKFVNDFFCKINVKHDRIGAGNSAGLYDIIFYDPPYNSVELGELVPELTLMLKDGGLLVYERRRRRHERKNADIGGGENVADIRVYADTVVEFYTVGAASSRPSDGLEYARGEINADGALPGDV